MGAFVGDKASDRPKPLRADRSSTNSLQQMRYRTGPLTHDSSRAASPAGATAPCWICAIGTARLQTPGARLGSLPVSGATPLRRRDKTCSGLFVEATDLTPTGGVVSSRRPDWKIKDVECFSSRFFFTGHACTNWKRSRRRWAGWKREGGGIARDSGAARSLR